FLNTVATGRSPRTHAPSLADGDAAFRFARHHVEKFLGRPRLALSASPRAADACIRRISVTSTALGHARVDGFAFFIGETGFYDDAAVFLQAIIAALSSRRDVQFAGCGRIAWRDPGIVEFPLGLFVDFEYICTCVRRGRWFRNRFLG